MIPDTVATVGSVAIAYNYLKHIIGKVFNIHLAILKFILTVGSSAMLPFCTYTEA